ncbi:GNAT family N-acetyltransferase [Cytobacillus sp.]|uniref:GNAT family N-acetyltransferase n=1 Tax=Cytobacillus sp. TaxID=2675269 RepID=UPI0028BE7CB2|nr:GNAT family N-acetyltransferase [Cytobacillus sp.]
MSITYLFYDTIPNENVTNGIMNLYTSIFNSSAEELNKKMKDNTRLVFNIAVDGEKVVGFKMGYELDKNTFYSWLGGVDPDYRKHGIASMLMEQQHQYAREQGYKMVQTKTMNKWRNMLILNIKNGFDVIDTYTDEHGRHKIVLEKKLTD